MTTLMNRAPGGEPSDASTQRVGELIALCRIVTIDGRPAIESHAVRERIAGWHVLSRESLTPVSAA